jgi:hypothetical protein
VYMRADINRPHPLFAHAHNLIQDMDAVSKNYYSHMRVRIAVLGYGGTVDNCIRIPFIYKIIFNKLNDVVLVTLFWIRYMLCLYWFGWLCYFLV